MDLIQKETVQNELNRFLDQEIYIHLETTNGAYAAHSGENFMAVCAYIRNGLVKFSRGTITGVGPYRVGLKIDNGWVYAEGLTDFEVDERGRLLMAGHDAEGRLAIALQISTEPFPV